MIRVSKILGTQGIRKDISGDPWRRPDVNIDASDAPPSDVLQKRKELLQDECDLRMPAGGPKAGLYAPWKPY